MKAVDIHTALGREGWRSTLAGLGIPDAALRDKHGPCPACGGKDRFRFDNKRGRGDFICGQCGAGDGFALLIRTFGWSFSDALRNVAQYARLGPSIAEPVHAVPPRTIADAQPKAMPTSRVRKLLRESCAIEDCEAAIAYLDSRNLWPLPTGHCLRAHPSVAYFNGPMIIGRYPALVARVTDSDGDTVTAHVTYLTADGRKLPDREPRKILSAMAGRDSCAVRLMPAARDVLGIAEGLETGASAALLHDLPVWAALNTSLLAKFTPPSEITRLIVFADRDVPGLESAAALMQRLQGCVRVEIRAPKVVKDWNDELVGKQLASR